MFLFCVFAFSETSLPHQQQSLWLCACKIVFYCLNALLHFILLHTCIVSTTCTQSRRSWTKNRGKPINHSSSLLFFILISEYHSFFLTERKMMNSTWDSSYFSVFILNISRFSSLWKLLKSGLFLNGLIMPYISYDWIKKYFCFSSTKYILFSSLSLFSFSCFHCIGNKQIACTYIISPFLIMQWTLFHSQTLLLHLLIFKSSQKSS